MRTGSSSSSASSSSMSACARPASCLSFDTSDVKNQDAGSEADERRADEVDGERHPEIELSCLLPTKNQLRTSESFAKVVSLSEYSSDSESDQRAVPGDCLPMEEFQEISTTGIPAHKAYLLPRDESEHVLSANSLSQSREADQSRESVSNINMNAPVVAGMAKGADKSEEGDTAHESRRVNYAGSQDSAEARQTEPSQVEQMIEEVEERDAQDSKETQNAVVRNESADPMHTFPDSLCNSLSIKKTFCSSFSHQLSLPSIPDLRTDVACKRPRLEIPAYEDPQTTAVPSCHATSTARPSRLSTRNDMLPVMGSSSEAEAVSQVDLMICGVCKTLFTSLSLFITHKRRGSCRLRFVCHCQPATTNEESGS